MGAARTGLTLNDHFRHNTLIARTRGRRRTSYLRQLYRCGFLLLPRKDALLRSIVVGPTLVED